jgi:ABC-2 type transport system ATP-binding protein
MAESLIVIGKGQLIEQCTVADFVGRYGDHWVRVKSPRATALVDALRAGGAQVQSLDDTTIEVRGPNAAEVGELAARYQVTLHELSQQTGSLEDAFLKATAAVQEYQTGGLR